ncbi:Na+/H+ antiporter subunit E [Limibaculum sp. FT325]|uniref:Na+/H+ antiporter subunit E n=1 Tax=Thermohalobaculum sediminis TaxID=2939436 RepID=UPI0020C0DC17|nr:Na+/H+ antiporter subunit E [Limibaculum sediminis]MCL5778874.1 Na+/H+ antiporter subunit E [Limibaculum sediminis]
MRLILITLTLFGYWLLLSGHYDTWLVASGGVLAVAVVLFSLFKGITDVESFPIERLPRAMIYWPWLGWQMILSALNVTRIILDPKLPISPTMVKVRSTAGSAVGITTYANSITLTPGTISVEVSEGGRAIWVHAITREGAEGFADDPMDRWVGWFDGAVLPTPAEDKT